jgi:hypothetical protein
MALAHKLGPPNVRSRSTGTGGKVGVRDDLPLRLLLLFNAVERDVALPHSPCCCCASVKLTLRNDNNFPVYFVANHVRIYNPL